MIFTSKKNELVLHVNTGITFQNEQETNNTDPRLFFPILFARPLVASKLNEDNVPVIHNGITLSTVWYKHQDCFD